MKNFDRVIFTPGLCTRSNNKEYYEMDNMVIAGLTGSGKDTLINAILRECILCNEVGKFTYVYIDPIHHEFSPFGNVKRVTMFNELISHFDENNYLRSVREFLTRLIWLAESDCKNETLIVVINNYDALPKYLTMLVEYYVFVLMHSTMIKFIVSVQGNSNDYNFKYFRYRALTRTTEDTSNTLIHCNLASSCADKYGTCWFFDEESPDVYTKVNVEFTPDFLNKRLLKSLSSSKSTGMSIVTSMNNIKVNLPWEAVEAKVLEVLRNFYGGGQIDYNYINCVDMESVQ